MSDDVIHDTPSKRQRYVLILAQRAGVRGVTVAELRDGNLHHGRVSSALSTLHREGKLARLTDKRDRCHIYVLPEFVDHRHTEAYGVPHPADKKTLAAAGIVEMHLRRGQDERALFDVPVDNEELNAAMWRLVTYAQGGV